METVHQLLNQEGSSDFEIASGKIEEFAGRERASVSQQLDKRIFLSERQLTDNELSTARLTVNQEVSGETTGTNPQIGNAPKQADPKPDPKRPTICNNRANPNQTARNSHPSAQPRGRYQPRNQSSAVEMLLDYILDPAQFPPLECPSFRPNNRQNQNEQGKGKHNNSKAPSAQGGPKGSRSSSPAPSTRPPPKVHTEHKLQHT